MMQEPVQQATPKQSLRATWILCLTLVVGTTLFSLVILGLHFVTEPKLKNDKTMRQVMSYAAAGLVVLCFFIATRNYKKLMSTGNPVSLEERFNRYRSALILYMAPCEGAAIFSIIVFLLTGEFLLYIIIALMLVAMVAKLPFRKRAITELNLDWKEQEQI